MPKSHIFAFSGVIFQNGRYFQNFGFSIIAPQVLHSPKRNHVQRIRLIETVIFVVFVSLYLELLGL